MSAPANNTLSIPLPPGMTGDQYLTFQGEMGKSKSFPDPTAVCLSTARYSHHQYLYCLRICYYFLGLVSSLRRTSASLADEWQSSLNTFKDEWTLYTTSNAATWRQPGTYA